MMHGRMSEAGVDYPDLGAVLSRELGRPDSQVPDYVSFYFATEGRNMAPGIGRLPRGPLRVDGPAHLDDPREHSPARRHQRARPPRTGRAPRTAQPHVRAGPLVAGARQPSPGVSARPRHHGQRTPLRHRPRAAAGPRHVRPDAVRQAVPGRPAAGGGGRAVRPRRPGLVGHATRRTSSRTRSWSPSSIT